MELKQHRHGPESGTGSHGSYRIQGLQHIHCKKEKVVEIWAQEGWAALGVRGHKIARWHGAKVQPAWCQSVQDSGEQNKT